VRAHGVVDLFPLSEFAVEFFHLQGTRGDLIELLGVGAVGAFDRAIEFRRTRRQHEQAQATLLAELLELGANSLPPSTCRARMGKGMRCSKVSRNWAAVKAVARV